MPGTQSSSDDGFLDHSLLFLLIVLFIQFKRLFPESGNVLKQSLVYIRITHTTADDSAAVGTLFNVDGDVSLVLGCIPPEHTDGEEAIRQSFGRQTLRIEQIIMDTHKVSIPESSNTQPQSGSQYSNELDSIISLNVIMLMESVIFGLHIAQGGHTSPHTPWHCGDRTKKQTKLDYRFDMGCFVPHAFGMHQHAKRRKK
jgi:hypothetical protein